MRVPPPGSSAKATVLFAEKGASVFPLHDVQVCSSMCQHEMTVLRK
jgi:hypothetical protein